IPSYLGYGPQDMGSIPPNSTLVFDIELVKVE
ncbi:MAG: FKBP-type peptidyl-prolyl cis-trans isomerase, partial [Bacteroidota bacterium]